MEYQVCKLEFNDINFRKVNINGKEVLFTKLRFNKETVPKGKYAYDIRHYDSDSSKPATIEPKVKVNYFGTIVTNEEYEFEHPEDKYIMIKTFKFI